MEFKIDQNRVFIIREGKPLSIGDIDDKGLFFTFKDRKQFDYSHNGWGVNSHLVELLEQNNAKFIGLHDFVLQDIYYTSLELLKEFGIEEDYQFGKQLVLSKKYWSLTPVFKMPSENYVPLHCHSEYSLLDGLCHIEELVVKAKLMNMKALALTDHGNLSGLVKFKKICKRMKIKPILGCEFYLAKNFEDKTRERNHVVLLAKNITGYRNLVKLVSLSNMEGFYYVPRVTKQMIFDHSEGLICLSACMAGIPQDMILKSASEDQLVAEVSQWQEVFKDDYYLELMPDKMEEYHKINPILVDLSLKTKIKLVTTSDVHYLTKEDKIVRDVLYCIMANKKIRLVDGAPGDTYYFMSTEEMKQEFEKNHPLIDYDIIDQAILNTVEVADKVEEYKLEGDQTIPIAHELTLEDLVSQKFNKFSFRDKSIYKDRIAYEMSVIKELQFEAYFILLTDVVDWARKEGIQIGAGRGSVSGSLVSFVLGITDVDPIEHGLIFERFLNPARKSSPDIDLDFDAFRRDDVFKYISKKWNTCKITTFISMQSKGAIRDCCRVYELGKLAEQITNIFPVRQGMNVTIEKMLVENKLMQKFAEENPELVKVARRLEGRLKSKGVHPAGIIVSSEILEDEVPLRFSSGSKGEKVTQYAMEDAESLGLLKIDCLSAKTQTVLSILKRQIGIDLNRIDLQDKKVFKQFEVGNCWDIFQFQTDLVSEAAMKVKPKCFGDLYAIVALVRPGAKDFTDQFVAGNYIPVMEEMKPILAETRNIILYQEQAMKIAVDIAGFTYSEADDLRKAIGKKKKDVMSGLRQKFIDGGMKRGKSKDKLIEVFKIIEKSASYSFNKCIAGDTIIDRGNKGQGCGGYTIEYLYNLMNSAEYAKRHGKTSMRSKLLMKGYGRILTMFDDGRIRPHNIVDIYKNGTKEVYEIKTKATKVHATLDHRFFTKSGWKKVGEINIGEDIYLKGEYEKTNFTGRYNFYKEQQPLNSRKGKEGFTRRPFGNSVIFDQYRESKIKEIGMVCEECSKKSERIETAHLDGDRANNKKNNLKNMCVSCHKKHDYKLGRVKVWEKGLPLKIDKVISIKYVGKKMTYDIEMEAPFHNYIANGFISHNSHAVAYTMASYWSMYFKVYHTLDWYVANLTVYMADGDKLRKYLKRVIDSGIDVKWPDINKSNWEFTREGNSIRCGLGIIKFISKNVYKEVKSKRPFKDFTHFALATTPRIVDKGVIQHFIKSGALDSLGTTRKKMSLSVAGWKNSKARQSLETNQGYLQGLAMNPDEEWDDTTKFMFEKDSLGFYSSGHPIGQYADQIRAYGIDPDECQVVERTKIKIAGFIEKIKVWQAKNGEMAFVEVTGMNTWSVNVWKDAWNLYYNHLNEGRAVVVIGTRLENDRIGLDINKGGVIHFLKDEQILKKDK